MIMFKLLPKILLFIFIFKFLIICKKLKCFSSVTQVTYYLYTMDNQSINKINIYDDASWKECESHAREWENGEECEYYKQFLCCKEVKSRKNGKKTIQKSFTKIEKFITNSFEDILNEIKNPRCILQKGHTGKCCDNIHKKIFKNLPETIIVKIDTSIYITPGNDDYIYKNRSNRNFPIALSSAIETRIRDKEIKLSCAIPLKDRSSSLMMVCAYIDYITYILYIRGVRELVLKNLKPEYASYLDMLDKHKEYLKQYFSSKNRKIFNDEGYVICPVIGKELSIDDITGKTAEIQLGHCIPRNDSQYTIRGFNILLMTRDGNRIIGDCDFCQDGWKETIRNILQFHQY